MYGLGVSIERSILWELNLYICSLRICSWLLHFILLKEEMIQKAKRQNALDDRIESGCLANAAKTL